MSDEQTANDIDDYSERLLAVMREAGHHGIACYAVLHTTDPISRTSSTRYINTADHVLALGMLNAAMIYQQDDFVDAGDDEDDQRV
jgi:hypothetical protein